MVNLPAALATEDELSEAVGLRLLREVHWPTNSLQLLRRGGNGYLRSKMSNWCQLSTLYPVVVITDLDNSACPGALLDHWYGAQTRPDNLLLRVAVRQIEAWLLADHKAMRGLLGKNQKLPPKPDVLPNAKQYLLQVAQSAKREVRMELVAAQGAGASQGIGYNAVLSHMVANDWSPIEAANRSESLMRALHRLKELAKRFGVTQHAAMD